MNLRGGNPGHEIPHNILKGSCRSHRIGILNFYGTSKKNIFIISENTIFLTKKAKLSMNWIFREVTTK
jgi:hypothetical protein